MERGGAAGAGCPTLDIERMQEACQHFLGEHDFRNFCKVGLQVAGLLCVHVRGSSRATFFLAEPRRFLCSQMWVQSRASDAT